MNSLQLTRGQARYTRRFGKRANQRAAKEQLRLNPQPLPDEPEYVAPKLARQKFATVSIACGDERVTFRVSRWNDKLLIFRGKAQAASTIGRRVALALDAIL